MLEQHGADVTALGVIVARPQAARRCGGDRFGFRALLVEGPRRRQQHLPLVGRDDGHLPDESGHLQQVLGHGPRIGDLGLGGFGLRLAEMSTSPTSSAGPPYPSARSARAAAANPVNASP